MVSGPSHELRRRLPRPGPLWGAYPMRRRDDTAPPARRPDVRTPLAAARAVARDAAAQSVAWAADHADEPSRHDALRGLQRELRRDGLTRMTMVRALAAVAACAVSALGQTPRETQLCAAAALLDQRLAEMATGEGKTLALGLAAAVAALAGMPVHVVTANDYLADRDARTLAPLYAALGLKAAALPLSPEADARRQAYANDIVYATARELAFDFLRDRLAFTEDALQRGTASESRPVMRGLCFALLDEADSILLDEADVPLVLSRERPRAARRALLWQALALARQLEPDRHFRVDVAERTATLTAVGERRVEQIAADLGGPWRKPRYRREAIELALNALHACRRDAHYVVRDGTIELLDDVTGRVAEGRVWSRGLHTAVALKEGVSPPPETDTVAQITFQRFFQRYWRFGGLSGTLLEARRELRDVLGTTTVRVPLHRPSRLQQLPPRRFADADARWQAVCARVAALSAQGRPVLVGTDSVADSQALSRRLEAAGVAHRVLNALNDAEEAAIVAVAGRAGAVTVATRMAGRGTDIELDDVARAAGGLHVLSCQRNPSQRLDRQLAGRAARQGDPGSAETWVLRPFSPQSTADGADSLWPWNAHFLAWSPAWVAFTQLRRAQWCEARRRAALRRVLLREDRLWERRLAFAGPSP